MTKPSRPDFQTKIFGSLLTGLTATEEESTPIVCTLKANGDRVLITVTPERKLEISLINSGNVLLGFTQKFSDYELPQHVLPGTQFIGEAFAVPILKCNAQKGNPVPVPNDCSIETGFAGVSFADRFFRNCYELRFVCPLKLYIAVYNLVVYCGSDLMDPEKNIPIKLYGSQIRNYEARLKFIASILGSPADGSASDMKVIEYTTYTLKRDTNVYDKTGAFVASLNKFSDYLKTMADVRGIEGYVLYLDRFMLDQEKIFQVPEAKEGRNPVDHACIKIKRYFQPMCILQWNSSKERWDIFCGFEGEKSWVGALCKETTPLPLQSSTMHSFLFICLIRCTWIGKNGHLAGIKTPWKEDVKGPIDKGDALSKMGTIEAALDAVPHWKHVQSQITIAHELDDAFKARPCQLRLAMFDKPYISKNLRETSSVYVVIPGKPVIIPKEKSKQSEEPKIQATFLLEFLKNHMVYCQIQRYMAVHDRDENDKEIPADTPKPYGHLYDHIYKAFPNFLPHKRQENATEEHKSLPRHFGITPDNRVIVFYGRGVDKNENLKKVHPHWQKMAYEKLGCSYPDDDPRHTIRHYIRLHISYLVESIKAGEWCKFEPFEVDSPSNADVSWVARLVTPK